MSRHSTAIPNSSKSIVAYAVSPITSTPVISWASR